MFGRFDLWGPMWGEVQFSHSLLKAQDSGKTYLTQIQEITSQLTVSVSDPFLVLVGPDH